jgi:hypothetical protein
MSSYLRTSGKKVPAFLSGLSLTPLLQGSSEFLTLYVHYLLNNCELLFSFADVSTAPITMPDT